MVVENNICPCIFLQLFIQIFEYELIYGYNSTETIIRILYFFYEIATLAKTDIQRYFKFVFLTKNNQIFNYNHIITLPKLDSCVVLDIFSTRLSGLYNKKKTMRY